MKFNYYKNIRRLFLILTFIIINVYNLSAKPNFLNIELSGNYLSPGFADLHSSVFLNEKKKYYSTSVLQDFSSQSFVNYTLKGFIDYGLNNYFSIYFSLGYRVLHSHFILTDLYDSNDNLLIKMIGYNNYYHIQLTGVDINIMSKIRLLHFDETLNYWFAMGPGLYIFKPKLKFDNSGSTDYHSINILSKNSLSKDTSSISGYINLGTGIDIKLLKRFFLSFSGYLKVYFNDIAMNFNNIEYSSGKKGDDILKVNFDNPYELIGYLGFSYQLYITD